MCGLISQIQTFWKLVTDNELQKKKSYVPFASSFDSRLWDLSGGHLPML